MTSRRANDLFDQYQRRDPPAHRPAVRRPDGVPVDRRDRLRALGVAAGVVRRRRAARTCTSGPRCFSAASSACLPRCSRLLRPGRRLDAVHDRGRADADGRAADPSDRRPHRDALPRLRLARVPRVLPRLACARARRRSSSRSITCCAAFFWPQSVYGVLVASQWRWLEHAAWVLFEDVVPRRVVPPQHRGDAADSAQRTAALEKEVRTRQQAENAASLTAAVGLALTRGTELQAMLQQCADALVRAPRRRGRAHLDARRGRRGAASCRRAPGSPAFDAGHGARAARRSAIGAIARTRRPLVTHAANVDLPIGEPAWMRRQGLAVVRRLSAAARLEAGRRHGDLRAARVPDLGAGRAGGGRRRRGARHRAQARRARARTIAPAGRSGDARQERLPREHEPRAAHAAERDHPLQRAAAGRGRGPAARGRRFPICSGSSRPATTCSI